MRLHRPLELDPMYTVCNMLVGENLSSLMTMNVILGIFLILLLWSLDHSLDIDIKPQPHLGKERFNSHKPIFKITALIDYYYYFYIIFLLYNWVSNRGVILQLGRN